MPNKTWQPTLVMFAMWPQATLKDLRMFHNKSPICLHNPLLSIKWRGSGYLIAQRDFCFMLGRLDTLSIKHGN